MLISPLISRLKDEVTPFARRVKLALSIEFILSDMSEWPCGYVVMPMEKADPNTLVNAVSQKVTGRFSVITAVSDQDDLEGVDNSAAMDAVRLAVNAALLNWVPSEGCTPVEFVGGGLVYSKDGLLLWKDDFTTEHYLRST